MITSAGAVCYNSAEAIFIQDFQDCKHGSISLAVSFKIFNFKKFKKVLIELKQLEGMTVGSLAEGEAVGIVQKAIIDPREKSLSALIVKKGGYFSKSLIVSIADIIEIEKNGVVINREDSLVEKDEIHKISQIIDSRFEIFNLPVVTKGGKKLGRIQDALIDGKSGEILRLYVSRFNSKRIIDRSQVIKITLKEAVVAQDEIAAKEGEEGNRSVVLDAEVA